jgi:two-component system cell cycle response regulator DivK
MNPQTVLLVHGTQDARDIFEALLGHHGYGVRCARDGDEAIAICRLQPVALMISELYSSGVRGDCIVDVLKHDAAAAAVPVLVATTRGFARDRERALTAGCDGFLAVPCPLGRVMDEVHRLIGPAERTVRREQGRSAHGHVRSSPAATSA